ncbi:hypothetical protein DM01DRAFT_1337319 [Hesseltinella vesiculosa]|uniref:Uncharacterized protein n=1 Tax=Hesseltinella vesiculosa TaxID=101127 RepID=A0A1X2GEK2_9FUNG|nr:hypothetical protein DM01DRAFT_1337319 [Hesseltinella vesiculosa]
MRGLVTLLALPLALSVPIEYMAGPNEPQPMVPSISYAQRPPSGAMPYSQNPDGAMPYNGGYVPAMLPVSYMPSAFYPGAMFPGQNGGPPLTAEVSWADFANCLGKTCKDDLDECIPQCMKPQKKEPTKGQAESKNPDQTGGADNPKKEQKAKDENKD